MSNASQMEPSAISLSPRSDPDAVGEPIEALAGERDADADGQALAERAGGDVDAGQHGRGMSLEPAAELRNVSISSSVIAPAALKIE